MTAVEETVEVEVYGSYSQLVSHRKCPQAWHYGYQQGLSRIESEEAKVERDFGSWWHMLRAAEALERGRRHGSLRAVPRKLKSVDGGPTLPIEATVGEVLATAQVWWASQSEEVKASWQDRIGTSLPERLDHLLIRWQDEHAEEIASERPLAVEFRWKRRLPSLKDIIGPTAELVGYVDEIYLDTRRRLVVARDNKTAKSLSTQTVADDMMDSQLQLYAWGASPVVASWQLPEGNIRATGYDRVRATMPKPPTLTLSGRLSARAGEPSLGQCDLATYLEWCHDGVSFPGVKKDGSGAGLYLPEESVIEKLSTPAARSSWFQRTLTPLNTNLIRVHLRSAVDSAADLVASRVRVERTGEAARNLTSGCRYCDFVKLCRAQMVGGPGGEYSLPEMGLVKREKR